MSFTPKNWRNNPDHTTPLSAEALEDLETRLAAYAEAVAAGGIELGYASINTSFVGTAANVTPEDVPGLSVVVITGTRPILVMMDASGMDNSGTGGATASIRDELDVQVAARVHLGAATERGAVFRYARLNPAAGEHTYKVVFSCATASGTPTLRCGSTTPASIQVIEC